MTDNNINMPEGRGRKRGRTKRSGISSLFLAFVAGFLFLIFVNVLIFCFISARDKAGESGAAPVAATELSNEAGDNEAAGRPAEDMAEKNENAVDSEDGGFHISAEVLETETEPVQDEPIELLFGGDVYLSNYVLDAYDRAGGISGVLCESYRREIDECDLFIANEEFPFSDRGEKAQDKQFTFRLPPERVNILKEMGLDIVTLANNHSLDFGETALLDTVAVLDEAGIKHMGAGKDKAAAREPVIVEIKGKRIGFIAASRVIPVSSWAAGRDKPGLFICYDPAELIEDVKALSEECDYTIAFLHWGTERKTVPDSYMELMARDLVAAGADAVIGSHPHVLQPIELIDGKPVVYSLGNFVFGSRIDSTMLFKLILSEDGISYELLPGKGSMGYTSMLKEEEAKEFIQHFPVSEGSLNK